MPPTLGAETEPYGYTHAFHEIFVLFGFLAAATERIGFMTGVVILPQRQTALVAKQAAALDVLSGGRLRFGIGIGWNQVEYEALGENLHQPRPALGGADRGDAGVVGPGAGDV